MKKLTSAAAARKRLTTFETEIYNPLVAEFREAEQRGEPTYYRVWESLNDVHDYLRRVASELGES